MKRWDQRASPVVCNKESACSAGYRGEPVQSLGQEDPLEEGMATHSSILAWEIPWTEEPGRLLWGFKELVTTEQLSNNNNYMSTP